MTEITCSHIHAIDCGFDVSKCGLGCEGYQRNPTLPPIELKSNKIVPVDVEPEASIAVAATMDHLKDGKRK